MIIEGHPTKPMNRSESKCSVNKRRYGSGSRATPNAGAIDAKGALSRMPATGRSCARPTATPVPRLSPNTAMRDYGAMRRTKSKAARASARNPASLGEPVGAIAAVIDREHAETGLRQVDQGPSGAGQRARRAVKEDRRRRPLRTRPHPAIEALAVLGEDIDRGEPRHTGRGRVIRTPPGVYSRARWFTANQTHRAT